MKKLFLLLTIGTVISLSSCSKSYTCNCGNGNSVPYGELTKEQAKAAKSVCESNSSCTWEKD